MLGTSVAGGDDTRALAWKARIASANEGRRTGRAKDHIRGFGCAPWMSPPLVPPERCRAHRTRPRRAANRGLLPSFAISFCRLKISGTSCPRTNCVAVT